MHLQKTIDSKSSLQTKTWIGEIKKKQTMKDEIKFKEEHDQKLKQNNDEHNLHLTNKY